MTAKFFLLISAILLLISNISIAQLDEGLKAHGTIEQFRQFGTLEFDTRNAPFGPNMKPLSDHHLIDLKSRKILITGKDYKIGFDGKDVWAMPQNPPLAVPPRFYISTPFYFFGLPFLFGDPGTIKTPQGIKTLEGKKFDTVKITFQKGVGDTPEDYYIAYFDQTTHQLHLTLYIVSYLPFRQGKSVDQLELNSIVFDEWQKVNGLLVPKATTFHPWKNGKLGEGSGRLSFENVTFRKERPDSKLFNKPEGAVVDESLKAQQ